MWKALKNNHLGAFAFQNTWIRMNVTPEKAILLSFLSTFIPKYTVIVTEGVL